MPRKRYGVEQIMSKLREAEVELSRGATTPEACRKIGVSTQTFYRWRREYGGLKIDQAKRLKEPERHSGLKRAQGQIHGHSELVKGCFAETGAVTCGEPPARYPGEQVDRPPRVAYLSAVENERFRFLHSIARFIARKPDRHAPTYASDEPVGNAMDEVDERVEREGVCYKRFRTVHKVRHSSDPRLIADGRQSNADLTGNGGLLPTELEPKIYIAKAALSYLYGRYQKRICDCRSEVRVRHFDHKPHTIGCGNKRAEEPCTRRERCFETLDIRIEPFEHNLMMILGNNPDGLALDAVDKSCGKKQRQ